MTREPLSREACAAALGGVWRADSTRWVAQPGDDRQHRASADCPCGPVVYPSGAVDHR